MSGGAAQAADKAVQPDAGVRRRKRKAQQKAFWRRAHGCDVAYGSGEAFPADRVRGVDVAKKMGSFQGPVTREHSLTAHLRGEQSGVIANPQPDLALAH